MKYDNKKTELFLSNWGNIRYKIYNVIRPFTDLLYDRWLWQGVTTLSTFQSPSVCFWTDLRQQEKKGRLRGNRIKRCLWPCCPDCRAHHYSQWYTLCTHTTFSDWCYAITCCFCPIIRDHEPHIFCKTNNCRQLFLDSVYQSHLKSDLKLMVGIFLKGWGPL